MKNPEIRCTDDLSIFKMRKDNRKINPYHVALLKKVMEKYSFFPTEPIQINSDMEVIDGQHRLKGAKELGIPVFYMFDDDFSDEKMALINSTQLRWKISDFINSYAERGYPAYVELRETYSSLAAVYPWLTVANFLAWIGGFTGKLNARGVEDIKSGTFSFKLESEFKARIIEALDFLSEMREFSKLTKKLSTTRAFNCAIFLCCRHPDFDIGNVKTKIKHLKPATAHCKNSKEYAMALIEVYNAYRSKNRLIVVCSGHNFKLLNPEK